MTSLGFCSPDPEAVLRAEREALKKQHKKEYDRTRYQRIKANPSLHEKHKASVRENMLRYYYKNREKCLAKTKEWSSVNPDKRKAQKSRNYQRHRDVKLEKLRQWYWDNREYNVKKSREWYRKNTAYAIARSTEWSRKNRDRMTQYANNRRGRIFDNGGNHTLGQWLDLIKDYDYCCAYCGERGVKLTRDHIMPLARGGDDNISNIVPACRPCNSAKAQLTLEEFVVRNYGT